MNHKLKPLVTTMAFALGSFCTPAAIRLANASTHVDLSKTEAVVELIEKATESDSMEIQTVIDEWVSNPMQQTVELKETESVTEMVYQTKTTFRIGDWKVSETNNQIVLTEYKGASKSIYIPGEYNGKQVVLKDFSTFPKDLVSLQLKTVNGKKVKLQTTTLYQALSNQTQLTTVDLSGLDTTNVVNMKELFAYSESIQYLNLNGWKTTNVQNMSRMFRGLKQLKTLSINHFKTDQVTDFSQMFLNMESLEFLDISSFKTTKATTLYGMFGNMFELKAIDLRNFTSNSTMNLKQMFYCKGSDQCNQPLLAIVDDTGIEKAYDESTPNRVLGANLTLDFNGGLVEGQSQYRYPAVGFFLPFTEEELELTVAICQVFTPVSREGYILGGWELNQTFSQPLEKWYYQLNGPYKAKWSPVSYSDVTTSSTTITGNGLAGGTVEAYIEGELIASTKVKQSGDYQLSIPKQKMGTEIEVLMYGQSINPIVETLTVLGELTTFTHNYLTPTTTVISGKGVVGAKVGIYKSDGTRLAITTVDNKGNYKLAIPKQPVGTKLVLKQAKSGYQTLSKNLTSLYELKELAIETTPSISTTAIYGTGEPGANVKAFVNGKAISSLTAVNSKGNYKIVIPTQKAGTIIQIKMAKTNYRTVAETVTVQNEFKTFTYNTPTCSTTTIRGKGIAGAKVGIYTTNGTRLAITTVNSDGTYQLTIPKQKAGTTLSFRQAKSGYIKLSKNVIVLDEFKTFTVKNASISSVAISGTGLSGAKVKAFVDGQAISSLGTVNSKGNYKLTIPKQKAGTVVQIKMAQDGYKTVSKNITVLNEFKTFTYSNITKSTTTVSGKGVSGAKVGIYAANGTRLAITTVNSKGNYKLTIPKQKTGTKLVIKQAKSGYLTASKEVTVVKG